MLIRNEAAQKWRESHMYEYINDTKIILKLLIEKKRYIFNFIISYPLEECDALEQLIPNMNLNLYNYPTS